VSNERLRWSRVTCAESYNVYRKDDTFTDTDGNGAAEDYGACLASNLRDPEFDDAEVPPSPIGFFKYLVTGFNTTAGEGTLDSASSGALRPNVSPCP
jgi:hypothetical protein